jgi:hypothetical protein
MLAATEHEERTGVGARGVEADGALDGLVVRAERHGLAPLRRLPLVHPRLVVKEAVEERPNALAPARPGRGGLLLLVGAE